MAELPEPERSISSDAGEDHAPVEIDTETVSIARIYDFALGGKDNFAVDRAAAEAMMEVVPLANQREPEPGAARCAA